MLRPALNSPSWARIGRRGPQILFSFCLALIIICFWRGEFSLAPVGNWGGFSFANVTAPTNATISSNNATLANTTSLAVNETVKPYTKPEGIFVSGLVFYGRRDRVSIMVSYLERNMVDNGGWLDEVVWIANTDDKADLKYLDTLIARNPRFKKVVVSQEKLWVYTYYKAWMALERGKYYVKIDDDILWIDDYTIPKLVQRKIDHPGDLVVSANTINNPPLGFIHNSIGALHPYFPELNAPPKNHSRSWRPSQHPFWKGPNDFEWPLDKDPPREPHRWLRVKNERMMAQTPAAQLKYEVWGDSYSSWAIAAQMHYSLLENIETNQLDLYKFEKPWNMNGERIRINFICIYADDILNTNIKNWPRGLGDEDMIAIELPKKLRRPVVILGDALASHFQYSDQGKLATTDLMMRYRALSQHLTRMHPLKNLTTTTNATANSTTT